jgi:hypothetical protein
MQLLSNAHISAETAYHVLDYPYGYNLRCQIRYWVEYQSKKGFRLWSQTSNPKRDNVWNKPKASTYSEFGGALYLDDANHVKFATLNQYSSGKEAQTFVETYGPAVPEAGQEIMRKWTAAKVAYDGNRQSGDPLNVGLPQAREAFFKA